MKVLLIGVGGVGEAIAMIAQERPWLEQMVPADYNSERVKEVREKLSIKGKFVPEWTIIRCCCP
jgi:saccharopine dehydrogenase (NAD+, L-lysine-forming)